MILGTAWYPERWPRTQWSEDLRLMRQAGIGMVRMGEFAWDLLEPQDGVFDFDWLHQAVDMAAGAGIVSVLGTPTAIAPLWLLREHPELRRVRRDGTPEAAGSVAHPMFCQFAARIAEEMARTFGNDPNVIGWQIDNELRNDTYDAQATEQFQDWLRSEYHSLEELARRGITPPPFGNQRYGDWRQVMPAADKEKPALALAYRRFMSRTIVTFLRTQAQAIRGHAAPAQRITHNFMGWTQEFDHYEACRELDFAAWDNYVGSGHLSFVGNGMGHDHVRGFKRKNFWVMETMNTVSWSEINNSLDRGEWRAMMWHAVGHGADGISCWQWRSGLTGEQYHGCLLGADGQPRPVYHELARVGAEFTRVGALLDGGEPRSQAALLYSYDDRWALETQPHHKGFNATWHMGSYYDPLRRLTQTVDIVDLTAPLEAYKLLVASSVHLVDPATVRRLSDYVAGGGHLVMGVRSGFKDRDNVLLRTRQPGPLAALAGATVEEYYVLDQPIPVEGVLGQGKAVVWAEWLRPDAPEVQVLLRYGPCNGWLDGQPAAVSRPVGPGRCTYVGAWLEPPLMRDMIAWLVAQAGLGPVFGPVPDEVEVCRRGRDGHDVFILINHSRAPQRVALPRPMRDALGERYCEREMELPPREVAVLTPA